MPPYSYSYLELVNQCGNKRVGHAQPLLVPTAFDDEQLLPFYLTSSPTSPIIGLLRPEIVNLIRNEPLFLFSDVPPAVDKRTWHISFHPSLNTPSKRSLAMRTLCESWRGAGRFSDIIGPGKWRDELLPVYRDPFGLHDYPAKAQGQGNEEVDSEFEGDTLNYAFEMERAACALFGIVTFGVHLAVYQLLGDSARGTEAEFKIWVPTRAKNKSVWPGFLDNTVAGAIPTRIGIFDALLKESMEEASFGEDLVRRYARSVGCISYFFRTDKGWLQPEVEYMYDLAIPANTDPALFEPRPLDGEVERFDVPHEPNRCRFSSVRAGRFKPNCALGRCQF
ncbi:hypothetical protein C8F01DRAFT_993420 [Mycena amicta]|nr:hypothetical protein C8F01DRAFT_993420 [Mycena amicta]